ncbi:MAG: NB-ARC domain-containing protein [Elainellaceae cyanobacterium]
MNSEQALEAANAAMSAYFDRQLSDVETAILRGAWQNQTYEQIAEEAGYSVRYIKGDVGAKFWKLLSQALGETVSKTNFRAALERQWSQNKGAGKKKERAQDNCKVAIAPPFLAQTQFTLASPFIPTIESIKVESEVCLPYLPTLPVSPTSTVPPRCDWGDAIDVSLFCGRTEERALLNQWIMGDRCRLVALLGMGGIGKTALAVRTGRDLTAPTLANLGVSSPSRAFSHVIWRSLRNAPPLETLLGELIFFLSNQQDTEIRLSQLMRWLRRSRCLIILDNVETILQAGDRAGRYRSGYENYGELLRMIGETQHQSCLMLTSREKPAEIATLEGTELAVRSLSLSGSAETAEAVLQANPLSGSSKQKQRLCQLYGYNPLALKMISTSIHELFDGDISSFLVEKTIAFNGIRKLLDQQFNRLSALEQTIMYWLAINREWTSITDLADDIFPVVTRSDLLEALESLRWRSLIEKRSATDAGKSSVYMQQPVVMEYVTNRLIEQICSEIREWQVADQGIVNPSRKINSPFPHLRLFQTHALLKTTIQDYLRHAQRKLIIEPIASKLRDSFGSEQAIEQRLRQILHSLHQEQSSASGYAAGNLINLCQCLQIDLTGYDFSHLNIWHADLQTAKLHHVNFAHANLAKSAFLQTFGFALSVALSPDDRLLATGDSNGQVHLWRMVDGQPLSLLQDGDTGWVWSVAFSPDGQQLASGSVDQTIKIWDVQTQQLVHTLHGHSNWVRSVAFNPAGQRLASGSTDRTVRIWDRETGNCLQVLDEKEDAVWSVAWHPVENWLATANNNGTLKLWDLSTGTYLQIFQGHTAWVRSVSWNLDGTILASGSDDGTVKLWNPLTGDCIQTFLGHTNAVWDVAWSSDGQQLASVSHDQTIRIWDIQTRQCLKILNDHQNWIWGAVWSADRQTLVSVAHEPTIRLWDTQTWNCLRTIQGHTSVAMQIAWNPDGTTLAASCDDQIVRLWNVETEACTRRLQGHTNVVWSAAWSPDGQILASSGDDRTVRLWEPKSGECLKVLQHSHWVWAVGWHPEGKLLATGTQDYDVKVWDVSTGTCLRTLQGHRDSIWCVAWQPTGTVLASSCDDSTVRIWNPQTGECVFLLSHYSSVRRIAWSLDGKYLATSSADAIVRIWDGQTGECLSTLQGHTSSIWDVSWSFDGRVLASGGDDLTVRLWDVQTGKCLKILQGHTSQIWSIAWHPQTLQLASSSADKTVKVWDAQTGKCLKTLDTNRPYSGMNITEVKGLTETQKVTLRALGAVE